MLIKLTKSHDCAAVNNKKKVNSAFSVYISLKNSN